MGQSLICRIFFPLRRFFSVSSAYWLMLTAYLNKTILRSSSSNSILKAKGSINNQTSGAMGVLHKNTLTIFDRVNDKGMETKVEINAANGKIIEVSTEDCEIGEEADEKTE